MKIQGCNVGSFQTRKTSRLDNKDGFGEVAVSLPAEEPNEDKQDISKALPRRSLLNANMQVSLRTANRNLAGFGNFCKESMSVQPQDIKKYLEELCDDETGVNIDVEQLDELLDIYIKSASVAE